MFFVNRRKAFRGGYADVINSDNPAAYWRLGETSGTTAVDETGVYDATYYNAPTLGVTGALYGSTDTAVTFNGTDEYAFLENPIVTAFPFTLEAWVNTTSTTLESSILYVVDKSVHNRYYGVSVQASGLARLESRNTTFLSVSSTTTVNDGEWHLITAEFWSSTLKKLYVDGVLEGTLTTSSTFSTETDRVSIGVAGKSTISNYMDGTIDEAVVFDSGLSADRILAHYNAGAPPASGPPVLEDVVTSYDNAGVQNHTIDLPATINAGDLLIIIVWQGSVGGSVTFDGGDGFTQFSTTGVATGYGEGELWYVIADGTEGATTTFSTSGFTNFSATCLRISGYNATQWEDVTTTVSSGASGSHTFPAITSVTDNCLILRIASLYGTSVEPTQPSGYTNAGYVSAADPNTMVTYKTLATAGTEASQVFAGSFYTGYAYYSLAIRPA
jgi:hypothetical protein